MLKICTIKNEGLSFSGLVKSNSCSWPQYSWDKTFSNDDELVPLVRLSIWLKTLHAHLTVGPTPIRVKFGDSPPKGRAYFEWFRFSISGHTMEFRNLLLLVVSLKKKKIRARSEYLVRWEPIFRSYYLKVHSVNWVGGSQSTKNDGLWRMERSAVCI